MKTNKFFLLMLGLFGVILSSCQPDNLAVNSSSPVNTPKASKDLVVSPDFKFSTVKNLPISITTLDNQDKPLANVRINFLTNYRLSGGKEILTAATDKNGAINITFTFPDYLDSVVVATTFIGLPNETKVSTKSGQILLKLGGAHKANKLADAGPRYKGVSALNIIPMGTWNANGVPDYLVTPDVIDAQFLNDINTLLQEGVNMNSRHPELLNNANQSNLVLIDDCEVWVTFIGENAAFLNSLGYYTYPTDNPPQTVADFAALKLNVIFPNCSLPGSGGDLYSGAKVKLKGPGTNGAFPKNTTIGWVLFANGFSNSQVTTGNWTLFSDWKFNPESNDNLKKHFLFLFDRQRYKFLLTVEDWRRDDGGCDNDFNDCTYSITAIPLQNVDTGGVPPTNYDGSDTDGDGVADNLDDYPNDPTKAYNSYYPAKGVFGSVAFEDLWPYTGDYDLNDMVIDCNFNQISNALNQVVEIDGQLSLRAMGATFKNGFGLQLPFPSANIAKCVVTSKKTGLPISLSNIVNIDPVTGLEVGQDKAVVILSDNGFKLLPPNGSGIGANTTPGVPWVNPDTLLVKITFKTPVFISAAGSAPYNPFIFVDGERGKEVHLPDMAPTTLVNRTYFGTGSDDSNPETGRYYRTKNNMPWAISFADHYDYPIEKTDIIVTHLHFAEWAISGGNVFKDWYLNKPGYRNTALIYKKP